MTKAQLVKEMREGFGITAKEAEERIAHVDEIMELLAKGEVGEKTKVGKFITAQVIEIPRKEGVFNGKPYVVEPHKEMIIKRTPLLKRI